MPFAEDSRTALRDGERRRRVRVPLHGSTLPNVRLYAFRVPPLDNGVYVVADERGDALVIDPSFGEREIVDAVRANGLRVVEVLNTHGHPDHVYADTAVKRATNAPLAIHRLDAYRLAQQQPPIVAERLLDESDASRIGDLALTVLHTPGHTEGSVCFYLSRERTLFSGDTLLNAGLGRTDLPGGDARAIVASLHRLMTLPDETVVYPGHGPRTTIRAERSWIEPLRAESLLA